LLLYDYLNCVYVNYININIIMGCLLNKNNLIKEGVKEDISFDSNNFLKQNSFDIHNDKNQLKTFEDFFNDNIDLKQTNENDLYKPISLNKEKIPITPNKFKKLKNNLFNYLFDFVSVEQIFQMAIYLRNKRILKLAQLKNM